MLTAIIQARMTSTRLPGKVMRLIGDQPMLSWIIDRAREIHSVERVLVVIPNTPMNAPILTWCLSRQIACFPGHPEPLRRFVQATEYLGVSQDDQVMRVTADCPLLDPAVSQRVVDLGGDYASNTRDWPDGLDTEVFTVAVLREAHVHATGGEREHVTPWIHANIRCRALPLQPPLRHLKWSVDTEADLAFAQQVYAALGPDFGWQDVLTLAPGRLCTLCRDGVPHAERARGSIGGPRDYTIWDLHEIEDLGGVGIVECPAWALWEPSRGLRGNLPGLPSPRGAPGDVGSRSPRSS